MTTNLTDLSISLKKEVLYSAKFNVPYLKLSDKFVVTESFNDKGLELNNLEDYTWYELSKEQIASLINGNKDS